MTPKNSGYSRIDLASAAASSVNFLQWNGSSWDFNLALTENRLRDPSAWYHIVVAVDTTQSTASNRVKFYVNGSLETDFYSGFNTYPSQNFDIELNGTGTHYLGLSSTFGAAYLNGYLAEVNYIDGSQLAATDFGEYDNNGVWRPIEYSGSYTGNSYYLKFDAADVDGDSSGLGNDWTATGFTTSGTGTDVMDDTPTNNWCTGNPLAVTSGDGVWTSGGGGNGNLSAYCDNTRGGLVTIPCPNSGKWYCEITPTTSTASGGRIGLSPTSNTRWVSNNGDFSDGTYNGYAYDTSGNKVTGGTSSSYGASYGANDVIGIAFDAGGGTLTFYKNGTSQGTAFTSISTNENWVFAFRGASGSNFVVTLNFGQRAFEYTPPTGFNALNTANLPAPDIADGSQYFNTVLYTGNGSTQSITGVGFQPDLVWTKKRSGAQDHFLYDVVRGSTNGNFYELRSSSTAAEGVPSTASTGLTSLDSDGFSIGSDGSVNTNNATYVAWCWKAGGTASSNTAGSITSTVSANPSAGFSIATYTGNGTAGATIGHGLGVAPKMIIVKQRSGATDWQIGHQDIGWTKTLYFTTAAATTESGAWNNTAPTSTVFSVGTSRANTSSATYVAYCFADTEGLIKTGTYTGNSSADGPFIDCGFKPAMVIIKYAGTVSSGDWFMYDTARTSGNSLNPNRDIAESSSYPVLLQNTGFKIATSDSQINYSGYPYVFIAFAENFSADTNYKALNTKNLPAPDIADGSDYFQTVLYTGNAPTGQDITVADNSGNAWQPDWVWTKNRDSAFWHRIYDSVRGATKEIYSNSTSSETTDANALTSFNSDGFTLGSDTGVNQSGDSYVAWNWLAGNGTSSNTDGSITSTVSANPTAGFSIVSYTGTGTAGTVGHGLGVAPSFYVVKNRDGAYFWPCYHASLTNPATTYIGLNETTAEQTGETHWNSTAPTSTVFSVNTQLSVNNSGDDYIAYCFAEVEGYNKFGSYTGNGSSTDGPFIYTGFAVSWVMCKRTDSSTAGNWVMWDNKRNPYNESANYLLANTSDAEGSSGTQIDLLSNGFKPRSVGGCNTSGASYIFAAFAENPFGGSGVSPATAR